MTMVQFFVRLISGRTIVLVAQRTDTISSVLEKVKSRTGMPMIMSCPMCLIYRGKQLGFEQTLEECGIDKDVELKLVARMESTPHPKTWNLVNNKFVPLVFSICNKSSPEGKETLVQSMMWKFLSNWAKAYHDKSLLEIFAASSAPQALVMLYMSAHKNVADDTIRMLVRSVNIDGVVLPDSTRHHCILVVLELCKLLGMSLGSYNPLYIFCRDNLRVMVLEGEEDGLRKGLLGLQKIFPFAQELAIKMSRDCVSSFLDGPSLRDINDFTAVLAILKREIEGDPKCSCQIKVLCNEQFSSLPVCHKKKISYFRGVFLDLLDKFDTCLKKIEEHMDWRYLAILKQLNTFSKLYYGCKEIFRDTMKRRKRAICNVIVKYAKRSDDIEWIFDCKEFMEFEAKRHLALMMLPELNNNVEPFHMYIDRSQLLAHSFEYIAHAQLCSLRAGLLVGFRNERATGSGVLREWFVLVCEEIFNPQNALFVACPTDRRRFLPNPG